MSQGTGVEGFRKSEGGRDDPKHDNPPEQEPDPSGRELRFLSHVTRSRFLISQTPDPTPRVTRVLPPLPQKLSRVVTDDPIGVHLRLGITGHGQSPLSSLRSPFRLQTQDDDSRKHNRGRASTQS